MIGLSIEHGQDQAKQDDVAVFYISEVNISEAIFNMAI